MSIESTKDGEGRTKARALTSVLTERVLEMVMISTKPTIPAYMCRVREMTRGWWCERGSAVCCHGQVRLSPSWRWVKGACNFAINSTDKRQRSLHGLNCQDRIPVSRQ